MKYTLLRLKMEGHSKSKRVEGHSSLTVTQTEQDVRGRKGDTIASCPSNEAYDNWRRGV